MSAWSQMSSGSKVIVFQMTAQINDLKNAPGSNERLGTEDFEINS